MSNLEQYYYTDLLCTFVGSKLNRTVTADNVMGLAKFNNINIYNFKRTSELPRIKKVLGIIKSIYPSTLLDIGTGRGVFLLPILNEFPHMDITCLDLLEHRVRDINCLSKEHGGKYNVRAYKKDCSKLSNVDEGSFDVVTALEVLEHIPNVESAIGNLVKAAKNYIVISVPSKEDDNPEHIHLFTKDRLREMFMDYGCNKVSFDSVLNHRIALIQK